MKAPIAAFLLVLAASSAFAQTVAPELAPAAAKYKADMATLDAQRLAALAQAQKSHAAALDAAEKTATAAGNLPVVAAITKEREALLADSLTPNAPDALPKNLLTTRKAYLDAAARIRANEATRRSAIGAEYLRALASLQSKAAANPELARQIAAEKGKLLATTPVGSSTASTGHKFTKRQIEKLLTTGSWVLVERADSPTAPPPPGAKTVFTGDGRLRAADGKPHQWQIDEHGTVRVHTEAFENYGVELTFRSEKEVTVKRVGKMWPADTFSQFVPAAK